MGLAMNQHLSLVTVVVHDQDDAIAFYRDRLGFELVEDTRLDAQKRWVVVRPRGAGSTGLLLAQAANPAQAAAVGQQTGGRVFLFLHTDDLDRDFRDWTARGVEFVRPPVTQPYGKVAVFRDGCGNLWDLIEPPAAAPRGAD